MRLTTYCLAAFLAISAGARAGTVQYDFLVDTSGIQALAGPGVGGWIDFQFNQANALDSLSATAKLFGFQFAGYGLGTALDSTGAGQTLPGPIVIPNDQGAANYFTQEVTAWGSSFRFSVQLSGNAVGTPRPDGSTFYVFLDLPDFTEVVSPPTTFGEVINVTIDTSGGTTQTGSTFTGGFAQAVPEPGTVGVMLVGLAGLVARRFTRR